MNWIDINERQPSHHGTILVRSNKGFCVCVFVDARKMNEELKHQGLPIQPENPENKPYYFCSQEIKGHTLANVTHWHTLEHPKDKV